MAQLTFDDVQEMSASSNNSIDTFRLENDGDSALVRILHTSRNDFSIYSTHSCAVTTKNNKTWRPKVNCLRGTSDDTTACPLCAAGGDFAKISTITYIHMIRYTCSSDGSWTYEPVIWERNANWVKQNLLPTVDEYADDLPNHMFRITRSGVKGDLQTKYSITLLPDAKYPLDQYPLDFELFADYSELGTNLLNKSFSDLQAYLQKGTFPYNTPAPNPEANGYRIANDVPALLDDELPFGQPRSNVENNVAPVQNSTQTRPWERPAAPAPTTNAEPAQARPRRFTT